MKHSDVRINERDRIPTPVELTGYRAIQRHAMRRGRCWDIGNPGLEANREGVQATWEVKKGILYEGTCTGQRQE